MRTGAAFRGQPLLLLGVLVGAWVTGRAIFWEAPFPLTPSAPALIASRAVERAHSGRPLLAMGSSAIAPARWVDARGYRRTVPAPWPAFQARPAPPLASAREAVGHSLMLVAGLAQMQLPSPLIAYLQSSPEAPPAALPAVVLPATSERGSRWSADGWLLARPDGVGPLAPGQPSYGRSQVGAVIRYRLADASPHRPQAYLRASSALAGAREQEVAAGLSARPVPRVPLRLAAEARVSRSSGVTEVRPALYAVTELPPAELPLGVRGEAYVQAGYVGGHFATAFVDGQARAERRIAAIGDSELRAGAGVWGGAQKGAARLDVGPTATVSFRLGDTQGRVAADYRFRVAGDAAPASGPALTLSAGF
jgi:hypothetical protein